MHLPNSWNHCGSPFGRKHGPRCVPELFGLREFRNIPQQSLRLRSIWYTGTHAQLLFPAFPLTTSHMLFACYSDDHSLIESILSVYRIIFFLNQVKISDSDASGLEQPSFIPVRQGLELYSFEPMRADDLFSWSSLSTGSRSSSGDHRMSNSDFM